MSVSAASLRAAAATASSPAARATNSCRLRSSINITDRRIEGTTPAASARLRSFPPEPPALASKGSEGEDDLESHDDGADGVKKSR